MGDTFYNKNGVLTRLEMKLGDGTSNGKKVIPLWKNPSGETIKIPQLNNMILNLCKYSFFINNRKSCSQYIDGSDLNLGKLTISQVSNAGTKSIGSDPFNNQLSQDIVDFTNVPSNGYAINTRKGIWFIAKSSSNAGLGIRLPRPLVSNAGDSFTLSITFAHNNGDAWNDVFQLIPNNASRNNDGYLRLERRDSNNGLALYNSGASTTDSLVFGSNTSDKIVNVMLRVTRATASNTLSVDGWYNGQKVASQSNFSGFRGNPLDLLCLNTKQTGIICPMNLFIFSLRVWDTALTDDEIQMLNKIEARNVGQQQLTQPGLNLFDYLNR